jgi:nucleoid DNA-binding protein
MLAETPVVTKKDIVKAISEQIGMTQLKTKEIVQKTFDAIIDTLVREERIELRNFGVFEVKKRAARKARNPRTGERVDVAEKYVVTFKPGKEMEERVKQLEIANAQAKAQAAAPEPPLSATPGLSSGSNYGSSVAQPAPQTQPNQIVPSNPTTNPTPSPISPPPGSSGTGF